MRNSYKNITLILIAMSLLAACNDIFEDDLTGQEIKLNSPAENDSLISGEILFWWDYIDQENNYHEKYNLMIVSPSFDNINQMVVDTIITSNKFEIEISAGTYQCWVFAFNGSSNSDTTIHSFSVADTTSSKIF